MNFRHVLLTVFVLCGAFSAAAQTLVIYDARDLFPKDAWNPPCKAVFTEDYYYSEEWLSRFYTEYIPLYRDAVAGAMDCCRAQLLPVKRQHKEVMEKLYALTQSAEYALSDSVPFEASYMYFELSEKITEFELEDELYKE